MKFGLRALILAAVLMPATAMAADEREDATIYQLIRNHEETYSIWPANRDLPMGWTAMGVYGSRDEMLVYLQRVWVEPRPLSAMRSGDRANPCVAANIPPHECPLNK